MRTQRQKPGISIDQLDSNDIHGGLNAPQLQGFGGGTTVEGHVAVFDANGCVIDTGSVVGGGTHAEVLVDSHGSPIPTASGDWIYVLGIPG